MPESKQAPLPFDVGLQASYTTASDKLHTIVRSIIKRAEMKQGEEVAPSLGKGITASHLSEALSGHGSKHFSLRWLPRILHLDRDHELLNYAASLVSCRVVPKHRLTSKQKLELLRAELRDSGADVDGLEERAYSRPVADDDEDQEPAL